MENATDALKIAFAVLVFVIALSVATNAFMEAKRTTDVLIDNADRQTEYDILGDTAYYNNDENKKIRKVGVESIIPTIYRAYKENYKIVFAGQKFQNSSWCLYEKKLDDGSTDRIYTLDLEDDVSLSMR